MTVSLTDIRAAFVDNLEEKRVYNRHVPVACYDENGNDYARDIEQFEYEMAAKSWIPDDEDYDYDDEYDDDCDYDDYDYE